RRDRVRGAARQRRAQADRGHLRGARRPHQPGRRAAGSLAARAAPPGARHRGPARAHRLHAVRRLADPRLRAPLHQVPRAVERAEDKVEVPGVAELIRALKAAAERHGRKALVYFVSASPPQIGAAIRKKLALDGVPYDGIVFKDQLAHLKRGKLRNLREHVGFKLAELLRGRLAAPPGAPELLFGDDWELDSLIYSLYADVVACRLPPARLAPILRRIRVDPRLLDEILALAGPAAGR